MMVLVWAVTVAVTAYAAYRIGRRVEIGKREKELERLEEAAELRSRRTGTVRLSTMRIRR